LRRWRKVLTYPTIKQICRANTKTKNEDAHRILTPGRLPWLRIIAVHSEPRPGKLILTHSPLPTNGVSLVEAPALGQIRTRDLRTAKPMTLPFHHSGPPIKRIDWFR
jgi:hypothetical protein